MEEVYLLIIAIIGSVLAMTVTSSPLLSLVYASKTKNFDNISQLFLVVNNVNAIAWTIYAIKLDNIYLLIGNSGNIFITFSLLVWLHSLRRSLINFLSIYFWSFIVFVVLFYRLIPIQLNAILCITLNFFGYAAPVEKVHATLIEKSTSYIDPLVTLTCLFCSSFWVTFGFCTMNVTVILPHSGGLVVAIFMLLLYLWAKEKVPHGMFSKLQSFQRRNFPVKEQVPLKRP